MFCSQADLAPLPPVDDIPERLARAWTEGYRRADFVGGEPTLYNELPQWIAAARRIGFEAVGLQTNGRRLAYRTYTGTLSAAGLTHVDVSLHGATAAEHEFHTEIAGSFDQTVAGIRRASDAALQTAVTTVLTRSNAPGVAAIASVVAALGVRHWRVMLAQATGRAASGARRIVPRWETAARYLADALRVAAAHGCHFVVSGLPPCLLAAAPRWHDPDGVSQLAPACSRCALQDECVGVDLEYVRLYGDEELRPVTAATSDGPGTPTDVSVFVGGLGRLPVR